MLNSLKADIKKMQAEQEAYNRARTEKHVHIDFENYTIELLDQFHGVKYVPTSTALKFHSRDDRVRVLRGHVGSGKTTMCAAELIFRAAAMPPCKDGVRRSRWALIRNTYGDLIKTTLHTWKQWWQHLGHVRERQSPSYSIIHTFNDGNGVIEMELLPIALDNTIDITKHLKSLEVTGVFLNELAELHRLVLDFFSGGRLPRFPRKVDFSEEIQERMPMYWSGIFSDTNPPEEDSWIYNLFEVERPTGYIMINQPPAVLKIDGEYIINPDAENVRNIPNGEQEFVKMTYGKSDNFINVYLMGNYGTISEERVVYTNYNDNLHSDDNLTIYQNIPLILSADLGTVAPTILLSQFANGRFFALKEFCGQFMTIDELCESSVMPYLRQHCDGMRLQVCLHDPADTYDGAAQLRKFFEGIVTPAPTNSIELRIGAVSSMLNKLVGGKPMFMIDRSGCPQLRKGFNGKYFYRKLKVIGEERYTDEPHKNHPFSDCMDCLAYACSYMSKELELYGFNKEDDEYYRYKLKEQRNDVNRITGY